MDTNLLGPFVAAAIVALALVRNAVFMDGRPRRRAVQRARPGKSVRRRTF